MSNVIKNFNSLDEVAKFISTDKYNKAFESAYNRCSEEVSTRMSKFCGTNTMEQAINLMKNGWKEQIDRIIKEMPKKSSEPTKTSLKSRYDVIGGQASVPRYLQGVPTNMIRQVRTPVKEKVVTINKNISFSCYVSADEITERCIDCLKEVVALENRGTRCNVNVYVIAKTYGEDRSIVGAKIRIKKSSERLNIGKMAFAMCHPSMLRRIGFSILEHLVEAKYNKKFVDGYGTPLSKYEMKKLFPGEEFFE